MISETDRPVPATSHEQWTIGRRAMMGAMGIAAVAALLAAAAHEHSVLRRRPQRVAVSASPMHDRAATRGVRGGPSKES